MADTTDRNAVIAALARAIGYVATGDDESARAAASQALFGLGPRQGALPGVPAPAAPADPRAATRAAVERLFAYWRDRCGHPQAKLTPDRSTAIAARLREGYTEDEIRKGIDGAAEGAFTNESNGQRYDDLTLVCRNGSKLESFISRGVKATGALVVAASTASPIDDQIAALRRRMSELRAASRTTEYEIAAKELEALLGKRKEKKP